MDDNKNPKVVKRRFVGRRKQNNEQTSGTELTQKAPRVFGNRIPEDILNNEELKQSVAQLPSNYNFEIEKTLHRAREIGAKRLTLQFPEGLLLYSTTIRDILLRHSTPPIEDVVILSDVTYGACCIDDFTASSLRSDMLVHYGHSCLGLIGKYTI